MLYTHLKKPNRKLRNFIIILIGIYVFLGAMLYFFQEHILFRPTKLASDYSFEFSYPFEELNLKPDESTLINALHFKVENTKGAMLYFHGNAGNLARWGKVVEYFVAKQYDVLVMDYRTYGKSRGELSEKYLYQDAVFCYNYLKNKYSENSISVYGRSLGSSFATYVASKNNPKQLILEAPFYNVLDVAKTRFPIFPVERLIKYKFMNNQYIKTVECPITIFHGTEDRVVPFSSGEQLSKVPSEHLIDFVEINNGNHNNLNEFEIYHTKVQELFP